MSCCNTLNSQDPPRVTTQSAVERVEEERVKTASRSLERGLYQTDFVVPEMHCAGCIGTIERGLMTMDQVTHVRANLSNRTVSVVWDSDIGNGAQITGFLNRLGFDSQLHVTGDTPDQLVDNKGQRLLTSLAVAGFAAANIMLLSVSVWSGADSETAVLFHLISGLIAVPAVAYAGRPFFDSAIRALSARRLNMDVPISLAVVLALAMSLFESFTGGEEAYFDASVTLLFFLLIGRYLDHLMRQRARGAVDRLAQLASKGGIVVEGDGELRYVDLNDIEQGMRLRINPGERLPVDGKVAIGSSDVDRALVTGEGDSIACHPGDTLEAGVLNLTGSIDIIATSDATNSFLAEVSSMMGAAEQGRSSYVGIADRMARIYAPAVHLLAFVTFIGWMIFTSGNWHSSIYTAIAVLIVTCPCALGLAVPVVHVIGAHKLMQRGILLRDGTAFERLSEADSVAFDKTGTLTMGTPEVVASHNVVPGNTGLIRAMADQSSHPAAKAIAEHLKASRVMKPDRVREIPGFGIEAFYKSERVRFGRPSWVAEIASDTEEMIDRSGVAFAIENQPLAGIELDDTLRPGAREAIGQLQSAGLGVEIMSGDHEDAVSAVAQQVNVDHFTSRMTPPEKIAHIQNLQAEGHRVLMVGDGMNDAPALSAAHVSMAPASASDVGRLASDFVFTHEDLGSVTFARRVALKTGQLVRQNFGLAIFYNCLAVPLAMAGQITPLIAAIAMSTSSIVVIANAMRLNLIDGGPKRKSQSPASQKLAVRARAAARPVSPEITA